MSDVIPVLWVTRVAIVTRSIEMGIKSKNWILSYWCYLTDSQKAFPMVPESALYLQ